MPRLGPARATLQAAWHHNMLRRSKSATGNDHRRLSQKTAPAARVEFLDFHENVSRGFSGRKASRSSIDNLNTTKKNEHWAPGPPQRAISFSRDKRRPGSIQSRSGFSILQGAGQLRRNFLHKPSSRFREPIDVYVNAYKRIKAEGPSLDQKKGSANRRSEGRVSPGS